MAQRAHRLVAVPNLPRPVAQLDDLVDRARDLPNGILNCREHRRHDWRPQTVRRVGRGFYRIEVCTDCQSERRQELDSRGLVNSTSVHYSEGYLNPPGMGRVDQQGQGVFRLELLTRLVDGIDRTPAPKRSRRSTGKAS